MTANNDKGAAGPKNGRAMNGIDGDEVLAKIRRVYNILGELV